IHGIAMPTQALAANVVSEAMAAAKAGIVARAASAVVKVVNVATADGWRAVIEPKAAVTADVRVTARSAEIAKHAAKAVTVRVVTAKVAKAKAVRAADAMSRRPVNRENVRARAADGMSRLGASKRVVRVRAVAPIRVVPTKLPARAKTSTDV